MRRAPLSDVAEHLQKTLTPAAAPGRLKIRQSKQVGTDKSSGTIQSQVYELCLTCAVIYSCLRSSDLRSPQCFASAKLPDENSTSCTASRFLLWTSSGSVRSTIVCQIPSTSKYPHIPGFSAELLIGGYQHDPSLPTSRARSLTPAATHDWMPVTYCTN